MIHLIGVEKGAKLFDALNSDVRIGIIKLLNEFGSLNLNNLAISLKLTNGAITAHVKKLQDAGLIKITSTPGVRGAQKMCSLATEKIIIDLFDENASLKNVYGFEIGIGHYMDYKIAPTCGIVNETVIIGVLDDPQYFSYPERIDARLLWFTTGYITYQFPNSLKHSEKCVELQISMELASEAPGYTTHYPSDIGFKINGVDLGFFTSPGEFNDRRGIFTPAWWFENLGQYGKLKLLTVNDKGCFIDGLKISDTSMKDLRITHQSDIFFSICVDPEAVNPGGVTIFGKGFGDYNSGITFKMFYEQEGLK
ncbi:MAG: winged helix-turn-helix transcriptional regulator [Clostridiales bacterium]|jgi:predicted transcriptional regulator|nr:winged helix-turn-helix transcriptional regulator [Clostridiales bacterium]